MKCKATPIQLIRYGNILSLDVVIGSVMIGAFACKVFGLEIHKWWLLIIALSVWVMYTADHLLDAWKGKDKTTIRRHKYHFKHVKYILPIWLTIAIISIILSLIMLESEIIKLGVLLGIIILIYFSIVYFNKAKHQYFIQKELFIALIYIAGIWLAPIVWYGKNPNAMLITIIANLVLLAWTEGIIVSWYEYRMDTADKHVSFSVLFGKKTSKKFIYLLIGLIVLFSLTGIFSSGNNILFRTAFIIELMMGIVFTLLISFPTIFSKNDLYRFVGEASFIIPGFIVLL